MFKKIALAAAVLASASFATWDYFPILPAGKGSAEAGLYYDWDGDWSQAGVKIGARYTVIQNLELSLQNWGYQLWSEVDCTGCKGGDGLRDLTVGVRYEMAPQMNLFLDLNLPIGNDDFSNGHAPTSDEVAIYLGAQYAAALTQEFLLGTEAGVDWGFEHHGKERGLELHVGAELDYSIAQLGLTPFVGLQFKYRVTDSEEHDHNINNNGDTQVNIWLGASYALNQQLSFKGQLIVRSGAADMGGDATGFYVAVDVNF